MLPMVGGCSNAIQEKIGGKNPGGKHFIEFFPANKKTVLLISMSCSIHKFP